MSIMLADLISSVPSEVESKVCRVRDQVRAVVQEALRAECRLFLRTREDTEQNRPGAQVPIEVEAGYPLVLKKVAFPNDFEHILLLGRYRLPLEQACTGASGLVPLRERLSCLPQPDEWTSVSGSDLLIVANWAAALLRVLDEHDPLKTVLSMSEDILGVYEVDARALFADEHVANRATIKLYCGVIGLLSQWIGCSVEDLAVVVLTHELAHAYTQLGAGIEGRRWAVASFMKAESALKEGLAQYYTDRVLHRLERRFGGALKIFLKLLPNQPEAYRSHQPWMQSSSPEAVRRALLEVRRRNERGLADFNRRLKIAQTELSPNHSNH
jgi:hypothetical protein